MIPKDGGNRFSGLFSANYANDSMVSENLTDGLIARGLRLVNTTKRTYDANAAFGGPLKQDRLWFFTSHRVFGYQNWLAGNWSNSTHNTPFYTPDLSRPAIHQQDNVSDGVRLTYQMSKKDKISAAWDFQHSKICLSEPAGCAKRPTRPIRDPNYLPQGMDAAAEPRSVRVADSTLICNGRHRKPEATGISSNRNTVSATTPAGLEPGPARRQPVEPEASVSYITGSRGQGGFTTPRWHHDGTTTASGSGPPAAWWLHLPNNPPRSCSVRRAGPLTSAKVTWAVCAGSGTLHRLTSTWASATTTEA